MADEGIQPRLNRIKALAAPSPDGANRPPGSARIKRTLASRIEGGAGIPRGVPAPLI